MRRLVFATVLIALTGCASNPNGSNWAVTDFNKYGNNYAPFPTDQLRVGMPKSDADRLFGAHLISVSADQSSETYVVERWASVTGPDYVEERLSMRFQNGKLSDWKIAKANTLTVAPRTW